MSNDTNLAQIQAAKIPGFYTYIGVGSAAILTNTVALCILFKDRKLLKKSSLLFGVILNHFLCGVYLVWAGLYRLLHFDTLTNPRHAWDCILTIFINMYPYVFQSSAALLMIAAGERFLVFSVPTWFHKKWTTSKGWMITWSAYVFALITLVGGMWMAWIAPALVTVECSQPAVFSRGYVSYYLSFSIVGGTVSVIVTVSAYLLGRRHVATLPLAGGDTARMRRQLQLTKTMLSICVLDFLLVVVPNILLLLVNLFPGQVWSAGIYGTAAYGANAIFTLFLNLLLNSEFRRAARKLIGLGPSTHIETIGPGHHVGQRQTM